MAASSYDLDYHGNAVQLWNVKSGRLTMNLKHGSTLFDQVDGDTVAFSPDGLLLASGSGDLGDYAGAVRLWEVTSGKLTATLLADVSAVSGVAFSPDGSLLAAASGGGNTGDAVVLWNVKTNQIAVTLKGYSAPVTSVTFSTDGTLLATGGYDGKVRLWSATVPPATN